MRPDFFSELDAGRVPSPCFVIDKAAVEYNLRMLAYVRDASGAKILAALKAFSCWKLGGLTGQYLDGTCASGLHEALLGKTNYPGEVHTFSPAFREDELQQVLKLSNHVVFNSFSQWQRFQPQIREAQAQRPDLKFGLRVNPRHSEAEVELYDPCASGSRLGITQEQFEGQSLQDISGLHFHTLCEQDVLPLKRTLRRFEQQFGEFLADLEWVNFGGGHLISADDYQRDELIALIRDFSVRHQVQVYLEPGEAVALQAGVLIAEVLDVIENGETDIAILDTSATCHMPDVLEAPYRPGIRGTGQPAAKPHTYRLGGMTCLAGDVIGDYSFDQPLQVGQRLVFEDMAHYTMVKTNTFNGINLPSIALWDSRDGSVEVIREFGYDDFRNRL